MIILALETSTSSAKAMLYDTYTGSSVTAFRPYNYAPGSPADPDMVINEALAAGRELAAGKDVDMIALSGTWHSLVIRDDHIRPLSPLYNWDYAGSSALCDELSRNSSWTNDYYHRTGCMVNSVYPSFRIKYLAEKDPSILSRGFMSGGSYFTWRLTGELVSTRCLSSGSGLLNAHTGEYDSETLDYLGICAGQLSTLTDSDITFPLNKESADLLGLRSGIPVLPANSDGGLNQTGSGALKKGIATMSLGTSGAIRITTDGPLLPDKPGTWCYRSPLAHLSGAATNGCCNCIDWARNTLFSPGTTYEEMENGDQSRDDLPVFLPFLFGERSPGWDSTRRGGFVNLHPEHNAYDMYRAVQEGVLFNLFQCFEILKNESGALSEIRISGGILKSSKWLQMCADIFGCTLKAAKEQQQSLLGACILAAWQAGEIEDITAYEPEISIEVSPNAETSEAYRVRFERYLEAYEK